MPKDTFILRTSYEEIFLSLTDQQAGSLIKVMLTYARLGGCNARFADPALNMAWKFIKQDIDYDRQKYDEVCAKRKESAHARWKEAAQPPDVAAQEDPRGATGAPRGATAPGNVSRADTAPRANMPQPRTATAPRTDNVLRGVTGAPAKRTYAAGNKPYVSFLKRGGGFMSAAEIINEMGPDG